MLSIMFGKRQTQHCSRNALISNTPVDGSSFGPCYAATIIVGLNISQIQPLTNNNKTFLYKIIIYLTKYVGIAKYPLTAFFGFKGVWRPL